jgi:hypothetical protein
MSRVNPFAIHALLLQRYALARRVAHAPIVVDIVKQQIAAFLPPQRPFGRPHRTAITTAQFLNPLRRRNDAIQRRIQPLDALRALRPRAAGAADNAGRRYAT